MKHIAKGSWVEVDGKRFYARSQQEKRFGLFLQFLKDHGNIKEYHHENKIFRFEKLSRGCTTYKPDYQVIENDGTHWWAEVKGWMDPKSKAKINYFKRYFPEETLKVIDSKWVAQNSSKLKGLVKGW